MIFPMGGSESTPRRLSGWGATRRRARWGPQLVEALEHLPIYYRSWADVAHAFSEAIDSLKADSHREHWQRIARALQTLADRAGKYAPSGTTASEGTDAE